MQINKTSLKKSDMIDLLIEYKNIGSASAKELASAASDVMESGYAYYPSYYYFENIAGKNYVLQDAYSYSNEDTVVYEVDVSNDDLVDHICKTVFSETVATWAKDIYEAYALYRIPIDIPLADNDATDVKVWIKYQCHKDDLNAPFDGYAKDGDGAGLVFSNKEKANTWIEKKKQERYHLADNEVSKPIYMVV